MDRSLRSRLTRPRHMLASVFVFLLLSGILGGLLGFVEASEPDAEGVVADAYPFRLAPPLAGDRGSYEVVDADDPWDTAETIESRHAYSFEWLEDQVLASGDASKQWANMLRVRSGIEGKDREALLALAPGEPRVLATITLLNDTQESGDVTTYRVYTAQDFGDASWALPCGFHTPLSWAEVEGPGYEAPSDTLCRQGGGRRGDLPRLLVVESAFSVDGHTYVAALEVDRMDDSRGGHRDIVHMRYWYRSDIPYPLRVQREGDEWALRLATFERGTAAVRAEPAVVAPGSAPRLSMVPRQSWGGPDESGIVHPFPLSAAYQRARDDPSFTELRDFLAEHPDAYVARAQYRDLQSDGPEGTWHLWYLTVSDGTKALNVHVRQIVQPFPLDGLSSLLPPRTSYDYSASEPADAKGEHPAPEQVPEAMPSVRSLWAAWSAYASPEYAGRQANTWGFTIRCYRDCDQLDLRYEGGYTHFNRTYEGGNGLPSLAPGKPIDGEVRSILEWHRIEGRDDYTFDAPRRYNEDRTDWRRDGQPAPAAAPRAATHAAPRAHVLGVWAVPGPEESAAIGAGAMLASFLYWLWPALKAGPAALFSRVRGEDLLKNPLRAEIHQRIEANPGIHHQALVRAVGRGHGAVEHHIGKLVAAGLVSRVPGKGYTCYFARGTVDYRTMAAAPLLKSAVARGILEAVRRSPGIRSAELARALGVAPATIHYHVDRLRKAGLLDGGLVGGALRLHATEQPGQASAV